jgi:Zn-finger nucleic acid-binding protein
MPVCPKCDVPLVILSLKGIDVDVCHQCRGLWFDAGELVELVKDTDGVVDESLAELQQLPGCVAQGRKHLCPRCDSVLEEFAPPTPEGKSLMLDRCPRGHGIWFDADELQALLGMTPSRVAARKTVEYLNEVFGAQRET